MKTTAVLDKELNAILHKMFKCWHKPVPFAEYRLKRHELRLEYPVYLSLKRLLLTVEVQMRADPTRSYSALMSTINTVFDAGRNDASNENMIAMLEAFIKITIEHECTAFWVTMREKAQDLLVLYQQA